MSDLEKETEPTTATGSDQNTFAKPSSGGPLSGLNRQLSEEELFKNKPAIKLLLGMYDDQGIELKSLQDFRVKYYEKCTEKEVVTERLVAAKQRIEMRQMLTVVGGVLAGYLPSIYDKKILFIPGLILAIAFLIAGFSPLIQKLFKHEDS